MAEKKMKPVLRFQEYTDDWKQWKVGELVKEHNAGIYISKEKYGEGINVIGVGNIYDNDVFDGEIYRLGPVNDSKYLLDEGDLLYGESSLVLEGIARTVSVGKNGAGSAFAWHTRRVKLDKDIVNSHFATLELNYHPTTRKHLMGVATQTALTGMTTEGYFSAPLFLPSMNEQLKISRIFREIDCLITLHQRKYEKLVNLKKSMLEKMFPQNGSAYPEIRFSGFTAPWEQRKLGDEAIEMVAGGDIDESLLDEHGACPVIANALTDDGVVGYYAKDYRIKAPAVTVTGRGDVGHAKARIVDFTPVVRLLSVRSKHDVFFLENAINTLNIIIESTGVPQLTVPQLSQYEIYFPPTVAEEKEIGTFFDRIDHLITLHQHKLAKLKKLKKSMLQKMFV